VTGIDLFKHQLQIDWLLILSALCFTPLVKAEGKAGNRARRKTMNENWKNLLRSVSYEVNNLLSKRSMPEGMNRPFTLDDLKEVPQGWRIGAPDFVGVASGSAGSGWWYSLLLQHPQVVTNRLDMKELYYFFHFRFSGISKEQAEVYRRAFAAPLGSICGEWSPGYLRFPFAIEYLAEIAPETKILLTLRNPVDRFISTLNRLLRSQGEYMGLSGKKKYIDENYSLFPIAIANCHVAASLKRLFRAFPKEQVLVLQYEKCKQDPVGEFSRTCHFLGIDPSFEPPNPRMAVNSKKHSTAPLTDNERKRLASYFSNDMIECGNIVNEIDLSLWM
jgi:hypothetical protein